MTGVQTCALPIYQYQTDYNEQIIDIIREYYKEDFENFGYSKEFIIPNE